MAGGRYRGRGVIRVPRTGRHSLEGTMRQIAVGLSRQVKIQKPPDRTALAAYRVPHPHRIISRAGLPLATDGRLCASGSGSSPSSR
jgi:hypothetical protein